MEWQVEAVTLRWQHDPFLGCLAYSEKIPSSWTVKARSYAVGRLTASLRFFDLIEHRCLREIIQEALEEITQETLWDTNLAVVDNERS